MDHAREANASPPGYLGLLGRIVGGSVTVEFFHNTPSRDDLHLCLIKHGEFRYFLSRRKTLPVPLQWVISSGRPDAGIDGLGFRPMLGGEHGMYEAPPLYYTRLVVMSELPVRRDTLLVRLLEAGAVLKQAIAELQALPVEAPERRLALPILVRLHLAVPTDPAQQTSDDKEFLMNTQDFYENWHREVIQQGKRELLLSLLQQRFGKEIDGETERRLATAPAERVEIWAKRVLSTATLAEILAD